MDGYLTKPIRSPDLDNILAKLVATKTSSGEGTEAGVTALADDKR
jgi:hypothetical protein